MTAQHINPTFISDDGLESQSNERTGGNRLPDLQSRRLSTTTSKSVQQRDTWGKGVEFLMSCIAMSVGLGNVWRFPFTALDNGGGAFLIPYLITLFLVGKPIYYLEMVIGQFSSRGSVKVFDLCPAMRGVGIGQVIAISLVTTYYLVLMSITLHYLLASVFDPLPWTICQDDWRDVCVSASEKNTVTLTTLATTSLQNVTQMQRVSSAELYFLCKPISPIFRGDTLLNIDSAGVGMGQAFMVFVLATYYESICSLIAFYLVESFRNPLPWAYCQPEWGKNCIDSSPRIEQNGEQSFSNITAYGDDRVMSSSEYYFVKRVLREKESINDGIGTPNWELVLGLFVSWLCVFLVIIRGVRSSGKASYFLALFPYVIMGILLVRAVTLPGAINGIIYFIKPDWSKILDPKVWYAAVTQCFFSLSVCFGNVIMYASYNKFGQNIYRDATIVTSLDTCTSLLAGFTIFGILGHLAHEIGTDDVGSVVKGDAGLAFISYPDAIAKFRNLPQIFSVLFFLMLFILGIGSNIAMTSCTVTGIRDNFPKVKQWHCSLAIALVSFCIGLAYVTPGGQFILTLVDFFGASMIALVLGIFELWVLGWVYGTNRLCKDIEFMLNRKVGLYWRLCWSIITPLIMTMIMIYFFATYKPLTYKGVAYPSWAYGIGWSITAFGVLQVPIWFIVAVIRQPEKGLGAKISASFRPKKSWGPADHLLREQYNKEINNSTVNARNLGFWGSIKNNVFQ